MIYLKEDRLCGSVLELGKLYMVIHVNINFSQIFFNCSYRSWEALCRTDCLPTYTAGISGYIVT